VRRPKPTANITAAPLFRSIELWHPTVLIDEMDTFLDSSSELYGILNSGHEREIAYVERCVGDDQMPRRFTTWCPRAYAMIGLPKRTLRSRSLSISLLRKPADKQIKKLPRVKKMGPEWERLRRQATRWAADHAERLRSIELDASGLANRLADNWEPLLVIAEVAGGDWPARVRDLARPPAVTCAEGRNIALLRDIRNIFFTRQIAVIPVALLAADLARQIESPWPHFDHGEPIDPHQLGALLGGLDVRSKIMKVTQQLELSFGLRAGKVCRGYQKKDFETLFGSYLTNKPEEKVEVSQGGGFEANA